MREVPCPPAAGPGASSRSSLAVTVGGHNIAEVSRCRSARRRRLVGAARADRARRADRRAGAQGDQRPAGLPARRRARLPDAVDRAAGTLAGGEAQRIRLATQIGSGLVGVLYVLDEPSIGLHQRDNQRLIETLLRLRDLGNTLIVVEHDEETIAEPTTSSTSGRAPASTAARSSHSGHLEGSCGEPTRSPAQYLSGRAQDPVPAERRPGTGESLTVVGARASTTCATSTSTSRSALRHRVTGVSGSGKSTLVNDILSRC
jgi:excinuclease ABC subunit A